MVMGNKKLNITFLSFYSGDVYRGVETYVHELANRLSSMGHKVTVIQNGPKLENSKYKVISTHFPVNKSTKVNFLPFFNYFSLLILKFTIRSLKNVDPDSDVLIPTNGQWQTLISKIWCVWHKVKLVVSGQSGPGFDDRFNVMCFPNAFVALSEQALLKARTDNPLVKAVRIPNGVDLSSFSRQGLKFKTNLRSPIILVVGALVAQKRIDLVIKAVSMIENASLLVVGEGQLKNQLSRLATNLLPGRFELISLPHHKMSEVYRVADIFTLVPEKSESFGIVYVEAMATNLPVVCIDDSIRREIVGKSGVFVKNPNNASEYSSALKKALSTKWKDLPRSQSEKFDWDKIAFSYEALFLDLIK